MNSKLMRYVLILAGAGLLSASIWAGVAEDAARIDPNAAAIEVDRGAAGIDVGKAIVRHPGLVRPPAELGRLQAFGDKALDRPGVDEDVHRLRPPGALGITLGNMDALHPELHGEQAPALAALRVVDGRIGVARDVEQRLLDEP